MTLSKCTAVALLAISFNTQAASTQLIDNASDPNAAHFTLPGVALSAPGKWTIVVKPGASADTFQSLDGLQHMQVAVIKLRVKPKETKADAFQRFIDGRREAERANLDNRALIADGVQSSKDARGTLASWCVIDPASASGHLTASLQWGEAILYVSYDASKAPEAKFREQARVVTESLTRR